MKGSVSCPVEHGSDLELVHPLLLTRPFLARIGVDAYIFADMAYITSCLLAIGDPRDAWLGSITIVAYAGGLRDDEKVNREMKK